MRDAATRRKNDAATRRRGDAAREKKRQGEGATREERGDSAAVSFFRRVAA